MNFDEKPSVEKYEIGKKISEDQVSKVYLAFDKISGEKMALHFFDFDEEPDLINVFQSDILSMSSIDHPNLIKFYKYEDENYKYCIIRNFIEGKSLYALLANRKYEIPMSMIFKIFSEVFDTISFLHEKRIFHGFLSPSNIVIDNGKVKLINYINYPLLKNSYPTFYQIQYFTPEQIRNEEIDQRSDIYTLGVILYEVFTGKKPYNTDLSLGIKEIGDNIIKEEPTLPSLYNLDISSKLEAIILKSMEKDKSKRYSSIKEFYQEFINWFSEEYSDVYKNNEGIYNIFENQTTEEKVIEKSSTEIVVKQRLKIEDEIKSNKNDEIKTFSWLNDVTKDFLITTMDSFEDVQTRFNDGISGLAISDNKYYMPLYKSLPLMCLNYSKAEFSYKETLKNIIQASNETELRSCSKRNEELAVLIHNIISPSDNYDSFPSLPEFKDFFDKKESFTGFIKFYSDTKKIRILNLDKDLLMSLLTDSYLKNKYEYKNIIDEYELKDFIENENFNIVFYDLHFQQYIEEYIEKYPTIMFIATSKRMEVLEYKDKYAGKYKNLTFLEKEVSVKYFENMKNYISKIEQIVKHKEYNYYFSYLNGVRKFALQVCPDTGKTNIITLGSSILIHAKNISCYESVIRISDFCASSIWENTEINLRYKRTNELTMENILNNVISSTDRNIIEVKKNLVRENEHNLNFYFSANKNILNSVYYKFPEWVFEVFFFEIVKSDKYKELKTIMDNISETRKITFFEQLEKHIFDIVFKLGNGGLCVAYFGLGSDFELIDFIEKIKEENLESSNKIKSAFYISSGGYTESSINFYNDSLKAKSSSFFDKSSKTKGVIKTDSEQNNFQLILLNKIDNDFKIVEPR
ncbi:MAG: serine/threonine-protein kinase [Cyanobacteriota bacterium]